ncbi:MAG: oligosaccharide flippase family protein [Balneolaceae bacterium]|nr:oligosaccharide flippase family protein [Balneolaceae bacterium]
MGIIVRQSIQNTLMSFLGVALGFVTTIWLYPRILTPEQYGLTRVMLSLAMIMVQFMSLGINNTIVRFFPYFRDPEHNHRGFLFFSLLVPAIGFIIFGSAAILLEDFITQYFIEKSALLVDYYWYLLPLAFFLLFFHVLNNFLRALYDTVMGSFLIQVLTRFLAIILLVIHFLAWIDFQQFILLFVLSYGAAWLIIFIYTLVQKGVSIQPDFSMIGRDMMRKIGNYGFFAFWGQIASIAVSNIDIIMLSWLAGLEQTGVYAIAFYVGSAIVILSQSVYKISAPIISQAFKDEDYKLVESIYKRSSLNLIIGGGLIFCGIYANLDNLMDILPPQYSGAYAVILIIALAKLFDMATGLNGAIIVNSKLYRFDLYSTLFLIIVTVTLNYLLIPDYGVVGAAIGTATSVFLYNALKVVYVWVKLNMQPFHLKLAIVVLIAFLTLIIDAAIPKLGTTYLDILLRSAAVTILFITPIYLMALSKELNQLIEKTFSVIFRT